MPRSPARPFESGVEARRLALDVLCDVVHGARANELLPTTLSQSRLERRDRDFVTTLVYGTTRQRRYLDWVIAPFIERPLDVRTREALRLGAYQMVVLETPAHAAVSATVSAAPQRSRGLVNAVLRRIAAAPKTSPTDAAVALSVPDWLLARLEADLGVDLAHDAISAMNKPVEPSVRPDGYVQDLASQWVVDDTEVSEGDLAVDVCAAPGGKATALATRGATVVAVDADPRRIDRLFENAQLFGHGRVMVVLGDALDPPLADGSFDTVLVDAPCSGLGVLHRRPDARWRIEPDDVRHLSELQKRILASARRLVKPGGQLVYSVCTITDAETDEVIDSVDLSDFDAQPKPGEPWRDTRCGSMLLPQIVGTDGMFVARFTRREVGSTPTS